MSITLELLEGPERGRQIPVDGEIVLGRDHSADIVLEDGQVSRRHAKVRSDGQALIVEDLESSNGTFINGNEVHGPAYASIGDEVQVGVTVMHVHASSVGEQQSAVRDLPPSLAIPARRPTYVPDELGLAPDSAPTPAAPKVPELERLRDANTKRAATTAPFAILVIVALALLLYFGT